MVGPASACPDKYNPDMMGVVETSDPGNFAYNEEDCSAMLVIELPLLSDAD